MRVGAAVWGATLTATYYGLIPTIVLLGLTDESLAPGLPPASLVGLFLPQA